MSENLTKRNRIIAADFFQMKDSGYSTASAYKRLAEKYYLSAVRIQISKVVSPDAREKLKDIYSTIWLTEKAMGNSEGMEHFAAALGMVLRSIEGLLESGNVTAAKAMIAGIHTGQEQLQTSGANHNELKL